MTESTPTTVPVPALARTADSADFFDFAARGRLLLRRCTACGFVRAPQDALCPSCFATAHEKIAAAGPGTLVSFAVVHRSPIPVIPAPYIAAIVEVEEGPWMLTRLLTAPNESVRIGQAVAVTVAPGSDGGEAVVLARTENSDYQGLPEESA
jgi:uncharacterized OB-fold protein